MLKDTPTLPCNWNRRLLLYQMAELLSASVLISWHVTSIHFLLNVRLILKTHPGALE